MDCRSREKLREYFLRLLVNEFTVSLLTRILEGLIHGDPQINEQWSLARGVRFPLLQLACQWKMLWYNYNWLAQDEMVDMIIKAGANVNQTIHNGTNALFFAVKYGTVQTVNLLLEAGCNFCQLDELGRTCWYNATEHPSPPILRRLLDVLSPTEMMSVHDTPGGAVQYRQTLVDRMLHLLVAKPYPVSWVILGPPTASDMCESLILLRQEGFWAMFVGPISRFTNKPNEPELFRQVAKCLVGAWLPSTTKCNKNTANANDRADGRDKEQDDDDNDDEGEVFYDAIEPPNDCPLCHKLPRKPTRLYCGHTFCRKCILNHNGNYCLTCGKLLCRELLIVGQPATPDIRTSKDGLDRIMGVNTTTNGMTGPQCLTDEQIKAEADFRGITSANDTDSQRRMMAEEFHKRGSNPIEREVQFKSDEHKVKATVAPSVDLAATVTLFSEQHLRMVPTKGPVYMDVMVKGIPLLARISNWSIYTLVSPSVVNQLGLRRMESLQSQKFVDVCTVKKVRGVTFTCIEPFSVRVGGIDVILNNAVEVSLDKTQMVGLQLGQDFLMSASWAPIDVFVGDKTKSASNVVTMRVNVEVAWCVGKETSSWLDWFGSSKKEEPKEMLRYYSRDGKVAHLPLLHFQPFDDGWFFGVSLKETVKFEECNWCRRCFPEGMLSCELCLDVDKETTYCGHQCQREAWGIHKKLVHPEETVVAEDAKVVEKEGEELEQEVAEMEEVD
ncbi:expressed unknown protein [Seminavis robusta]|uniref:RING-type domain-containing protein n=1 Tax=Seminavis robusta TaxID=568900 RepID=A0A9N8EIZ6_9STRA|nr:expressed unknown protein [Seminavis robusta]|eukprot:Sro1277_g258680.1 n/a (726) ;mRNA; f:13705-15922